MSWTRRAVALAGALVLGVSLVACGAAPSGPDISGLVEGCVGSWELESAEFDEGDVDAETLEEMESYGMRVTLDLDADGELLIDAFGQQQRGTWELRDAGALTLTLEGESVDAPLADGRLTLAYDGETLVFTKTSDEPVMDRDPSDNAGELGMDGLDDLEETVATSGVTILSPRSSLTCSPTRWWSGSSSTPPASRLTSRSTSSRATTRPRSSGSPASGRTPWATRATS